MFFGSKFKEVKVEDYKFEDPVLQQKFVEFKKAVEEAPSQEREKLIRKAL